MKNTIFVCFLLKLSISWINITILHAAFSIMLKRHRKFYIKVLNLCKYWTVAWKEKVINISSVIQLSSYVSDPQISYAQMPFKVKITILYWPDVKQIILQGSCFMIFIAQKLLYKSTSYLPLTSILYNSNILINV